MKTMYGHRFQSVEEIQDEFEKGGYICSKEIATCLYIAYNLQKPMMVEGPAGVGKTEMAKTTAEILGVPLVRLQCYEGLDESKALYEWKYGKQLLYTQLLKEKLHDFMGDAETMEESMAVLHSKEDLFFSEDFLEPRPLFKALKEKAGCVLLIDEVDKSDHEFEAFLLEILSEFQVSIPEIGTLTADIKPFVFLTSNNNREMSDALKRRCLHLNVPYPEPDLERRILNSRVPELRENLQKNLVDFIHKIREMDLKKSPSISETIDWARVLVLLNAEELDKEFVETTLNTVLKFEDDIEAVNEQLDSLLESVHSAA